MICEILDYDGNSASSDFLKSFSVKHGFDVVSVEDLCLYLENNNIDIRFATNTSLVAIFYAKDQKIGKGSGPVDHFYSLKNLD